MNNTGYAVGQAVFLRTDTLDYAEESIPFRDLEELVRICSESHPNLTLDKVVIYSTLDSGPVALTLSFVSASKGLRPAHLQIACEKPAN